MNKQIRILLTLVLLLSFNEVIFAQDGNEELDSLIQNLPDDIDWPFDEDIDFPDWLGGDSIDFGSFPSHPDDIDWPFDEDIDFPDWLGGDSIDLPDFLGGDSIDFGSFPSHPDDIDWPFDEDIDFPDWLGGDSIDLPDFLGGDSIDFGGFPSHPDDIYWPFDEDIDLPDWLGGDSIDLPDFPDWPDNIEDAVDILEDFDWPHNEIDNEDMDDDHPLDLAQFFDICNNNELAIAPVVSDIFSQSSMIYLPSLFYKGTFEFRKEGELDWVSYNAQLPFMILSDLEDCTSYELRMAYTCENETIYSSVQTFTTKGCEDCSVIDMELFASNTLGQTAQLHWDIIPGAIYHLNYKKDDEQDWKTYNTAIPFAVLFGLDECTKYDFCVEVTCEMGFKSSPSDIIGVETGTCKTAADIIANENNINVLPVLATNFIQVTLNTESKLSSIQIFNSAGGEVKNISKSMKSSAAQNINITNLPNGYYLVVAHTANQIYTSKFIKK